MDDKLRSYLINHQYELPHKLYHFAYRFPYVTFYQALELYEISVREVLTLYRAKNLYDEPLSFGRGLVRAQKLWLEKMERAEKIKGREKIEE